MQVFLKERYLLKIVRIWFELLISAGFFSDKKTTNGNGVARLKTLEINHGFHVGHY